MDLLTLVAHQQIINKTNYLPSTWKLNMYTPFDKDVRSITLIQKVPVKEQFLKSKGIAHLPRIVHITML